MNNETFVEEPASSIDSDIDHKIAVDFNEDDNFSSDSSIKSCVSCMSDILDEED